MFRETANDDESTPESSADRRVRALEARCAELSGRLEEAEETLRALQAGDVDAILVGGDIYTLATVDAASNRFRGDALAQMEDAVVATDNEHRVIYLNPAAERLYRKANSEVLGLGREQLFGQNWLSRQDRYECEQALEQGGFWRGQTLQTIAADQPLQLECTFSCMHDDHGQRTGYLAVMRDISAHANAEAALAESQARLKFALDSAKVGDWNVDLATGEMAGSALFDEILGYPPGTERWSVERMLAAVHPDDRGAVDRAFRNAAASAGEYHIAFRVAWPNQTIHWIEMHASVFLQRGHRARMVGTVADITERKTDEETLREADRRKDEFLATLAHELRNPLAPIRNAAQALLASSQSAATLEKSAAIIQRQVAQMARLLDDLLDVARITRGQLSLKKEVINLQDVVATAVETARPAVDAKGHTLVIDLPEEKLWLEADPVRLAQVISNLLNNAAKYSDPGARITILGGRITDLQCYLTVRDTGIGLSPTALNSVFKMFSQEDTALDRSEGGLGIGLALVKGLAELHGGMVSASSPGIGRGSDFTVRLPCESQPTVELRMPEHVAGSQAPCCRVVIADDNRDAAQSLAIFVELVGHEVRTAHNGTDAFELAKAFRPQAMVLDIGMPGMNGYELARKVRHEPWGAQVLLVAATGWGQDDDRNQAFASGFNAHLTKPFNPEDVVRLIGQHVGQAG